MAASSPGPTGRARTAAPNSDLDGRGRVVAPTSGGRDLIDAAFTDHMANEHRLVSALTPAQQTRLAELLHIWVGAFEGDTHHS